MGNEDDKKLDKGYLQSLHPRCDVYCVTGTTYTPPGEFPHFNLGRRMLPPLHYGRLIII